MDEFTVTINIGGEAMQTKDDIADALIKIAAHLKMSDGIHPGDRYPVWDENGNKVGSYEGR